MPRPAQFDPALVRSRAPAPAAKRRKPELQGATRVLRNRRIRLYRAIERTQETVAKIEAELRERGVVLHGPSRRPGHLLPFRHNELPRLALSILRATGQPMARPGDRHCRDTGKGLDPLDRALADVTVKRMRDVLLLHKRKGIVRLVRFQRARSARWALVEE
jgi:hypothetical protein